MFAAQLGDGSQFGLQLDCVEEKVPLGTGGGIRHAAAWLRSGPDDPVVVLNGDVLSGHDLGAQLELHVKHDAAVTLHLVEVPDPARFGCVPTDSSGRVTAFLEKTPHPVTNRINAGCYVFKRRVIDEIPAGQVISVERVTFPALIGSGQLLMGYPDSAYWLDVGTPGELRPRVMRPGARRAGVSRAARTVRGGAGAARCRARSGRAADRRNRDRAGSHVGAGARVDGSVLFDGVTIGAGARISGSVIGAAASIGDGAVLDGAVIGDGARIGTGNELCGGLRVWPGTDLGPTSIRFSTDA